MSEIEGMVYAETHAGGALVRIGRAKDGALVVEVTRDGPAPVPMRLVLDGSMRLNYS